MNESITPITERQLNLITRAHRETQGFIEPLLTLKGGAKLITLKHLNTRGLIESIDGQWRITPVAIAIIKGEAQPQDVLPPMGATGVAASVLADDPKQDAAVVTAKRSRENSKQAQVIAMLQRPEGATIAQIMAVTGWQAHTVRGTFAGTFKKKGLNVTASKSAGCDRLYRLATGQSS